MSRTFIFILLMFLPLASRSQTVVINNVVYTINTMSGDAKVVRVTDNLLNEYPIQETVEYDGKKFPVTSIGEGAFSLCHKMESLVIPSSVVDIALPIFSTYSLYPDRMLSSIVVAPDNPKYDSRNGCNALIETATNILLLGSSKTVVPNTVTVIAKHAFWGLEGLKKFSLPNSVKEICDSAFVGTKNLTTFMFPDSLSLIGDYAFLYSGLTNIKLPNSLRHIGEAAFFDCGNHISFSPGLLILPDSMDYIGEGAFANSTVSTAVFPRKLESISRMAFSSCKYLTTVIIPETVVNIGDSAFRCCDRLSEVKILGSSLKSIGKCTFKDCPSLTSINIPNSVIEICDSAFLRCKSLSGINVPPTLSFLGSAFKDCRNLKLRKVNLSPYLTEIRDETFYHCSIDSIIIPNSVKRIGKSAFAYSKLSTVKLPEGLETIEDSTFLSCKFNRIIPPTMAEEGGDSCLILPPSLKHVGKYGFADNRRLTCVILPNSLKTIGYRAFSIYNDTHRILKSVVIPAGVEEIGTAAFSHGWRYNYSPPSMVDDLKDIYCHVVTPLDCSPFSEPSEKTLHVPAQSVGLYRNHSYWGKFKEIVPLTDEETGISPTTMREPDDGIHYSLSGSRVSPNSKGIHVVKYDDGTVRKVICK